VQVPDPSKEPTMSVERAAECLGIGRSSAYKAVRAGEIPSIRVGTLIRVPTAALCRLLQGEGLNTPRPA
jgi:excisionase family DNA binding protein